MHYIGLIILLIIVIITILYFIKISRDNNDLIIEKYNTQTIQNVSADYLNTNGNPPVIHNSTLDSHNYVRSPTMNDHKTSTATFRPCQIHFNNDGTSKYVYEDGWQEFSTLISQEDNSVYNVPFKKFANDNNNVGEFENFNETTKCFKKKNIRINLNTYKYKSNDLISYKPDSYVAVQYKNDKDVVSTDYFMQMFFNKQSGDTSLNKYKEDSLDSICSYNYKRDLSLGNIENLYRLTIVPVSNNQNIPIDPNSIKDGIITSIDSVTIANEDNSEFRTRDKQITEDKFSELLVGRNISYYTITNGNILYRIDKQQVSGTDLEGLLVNIYKFNRNLDCSDDKVIKSYEIVEARLKSHLLLNADPYISTSINSQNLFPADEIISNPNNYIPNNSIEETLSQEINGISKDILIKVLNATNKNTYNTKDELLEYILYFILKIIVISNRNLITQIIDLMNLNKQNSERKHEYIRSFNTIQKFMKLYRDNQGDNLKKEILEDIRRKKNIEFDQIYMHKFKSIDLLPSDEIIPFTLENINDKISNLHIYTIDTESKQFIINQPISCDILIVAGGGAGGRNRFPSGRAGGGGGAGGVIYLQNHNLSAGLYDIKVGDGGNIDEGGNNSGEGFNGGNSSFGTFIAIGGGGGGTTFQDKHNSAGRNGGSGGGAGAGAGEHFIPPRKRAGNGVQGGNGVAGQGFSGGNNWADSWNGGAGAGGGGAEQDGRLWKNDNWNPAPGTGGRGRSISITGTPVIYAKGGDGGWWDGSNTPISGLPNTGNGGDGAHNKPAGKGGSGIVIVKINTELKRSGYDSIKKENTKRKFTIYGNELKINDLSSKIIIKERDVVLTINNSNIVTLKKNTTYIIDRANSQEIRIRENIESEKIVKEIDFVYTTPGNHTFKVPADVTNICILCVGGGGGGNTYTNDGGGGGGGGLMWVNNLNVTPGQDFNIIVGYGGSPGNSGATSVFYNSEIRIEATGGNSSGNKSAGGTGGSFGLSYYKNIEAGGGYGGNGGNGSYHYPGQDLLAGGGGGAGGYLGKGGNGSTGDWYNVRRGENGQGGGGGGGGRGNSLGGGGGGIGLYGIGSDGIGITADEYINESPGGGGGSGGSSGNGINGGVYGGGGGGGDYMTGGSGGHGAVRIICTQSKKFPSNAGAAQGSIIIPGVYNNIATFNKTSIELSYDVEDINLLNFNSVKNNTEIDDNQVQRIIGRKEQSNSSMLYEYEYRIGTKTKDEYLKVGIMMSTLYSEAMELNNAQLGQLMNFINPNGKGALIYDDDFVQVSQNNTQDNDIVTMGSVFIFKNTFSGDIFLKTYFKCFIYDITIDPNKKIFQEVESDFINGRNNNNSLVSIISTYESRINSYFNLDTYDNDSKQIYNLSTHYSINSEDRTLKIGGLTDARRDILTKLQNIYNSVLIFKASESSRKPKISFVDNKKVKDIIDSININNISYENPINKQAESYNKLNYHHQPISKNYIYFKYPK